MEGTPNEALQADQPTHQGSTIVKSQKVDTGVSPISLEANYFLSLLPSPVFPAMFSLPFTFSSL